MDPRTCRLIQDYIEGDLSETDAARLAEHLQSDEGDREAFLTLVRQGNVLQELFAAEPDKDVAPAVEREIRARRDEGRFVGDVLRRISHRRTSSRASRRRGVSRRSVTRARPLLGAYPFVAAAMVLFALLGILLAVRPERPRAREGGAHRERLTAASYERRPAAAARRVPRKGRPTSARKPAIPEIGQASVPVEGSTTARSGRATSRTRPRAIRPHDPAIAVPALPEQVQSPEPNVQTPHRAPRVADRPTAAGGPEPDAEGQRTAPALARIARVEGLVLYARGARGKWVKATGGLLLLAEDRIDTRTGLVRLDLDEGFERGVATVSVNRGTVLRLVRGRTDAGLVPLVDLSRGEVFVTDDRIGVHVLTPDGLIAPVGTRFDVKRSVAATVITVQDGMVNVRARERPDRRRPTRRRRKKAVIDLRGLGWVKRVLRVEANHQTRVRMGGTPSRPAAVDAAQTIAWIRQVWQPRILFAEDFEKAAVGTIPQTFLVGRPGLWAVRERGGNRVLEGSGKMTTLHFGAANWTDYEVRVRFRFPTAPQVVGLIVRHDPATGANYQLELVPDGARLRKSLSAKLDDPNVIPGSRVRPAPGVWHTLRAVCKGPLVELWVDGALAVRSREPHTRRGKCKLYVRGGMVSFDDLIVREVVPTSRREKP